MSEMGKDTRGENQFFNEQIEPFVDGQHHPASPFDERGPGTAKPSPELVTNLTFGGPKRNRLFITGVEALYAIYVAEVGAQSP